MSYLINKKNQKIAYKSSKGTSVGIIFIHGLNSNMTGLKAISIEKYAKKKIFLLSGLIAEAMANHLVNLKILLFLIGEKI